MQVKQTTDHFYLQDRMLLWFATTGGSGAWLAHFALIWLISEFGCIANFDRHLFGPLSAVSLLIILATLLMAAVGSFATLAAYSLKKRLASPSRGSQLARSRRESMEMWFLANASFVIIILVQSIPVLYFLETC